MKRDYKVVVIDGQGGGIGVRLVSALRTAGLENIHITAVGTNVLATNAMLKAGADDGASGENAVVYNSSRADIIICPIGAMAANAMLGEITPAMAGAISGSGAYKVLIPSSKCRIRVAGVENAAPPAYIAHAVTIVSNLVNEIYDTNKA